MLHGLEHSDKKAKLRGSFSQSFEVEMKWRTYLLLAAVVNCWSVVQLSGSIYTLTKGHRLDLTYEVRCFYNGTDPKPWDIRLMAENSTLETLPVDDFTISYRVNVDKLRFNGWKFRCIFPDNGSTEATIADWNFLREFLLDCFYSDNETVLECQFLTHRPRKELETTRILLTMDNKFQVDCIYSHEEFPPGRCYLQYPPNLRRFSRTFTLELVSHGILQKQVYQRTDIQMRKPYWPSNKPLIEQLGLAICVDFGSHGFNRSESYGWEVTLQSPNLQKAENPGIISYSEAGFNVTKDVCFEIPHHHYHTYTATLLVRFDHTDAPWSTSYSGLRFTPKPSQPDMIPQFLPSGFYYEPEKNMLHVYWYNHELEFNGPNFSYIVVLNTGKKALVESNISAVVHDWDPTQPATFYLSSQNSMGRSEDSDKMTVPILTNYTRRQPRNLKYHVESKNLTWDPPQEEHLLSSYNIIYCNKTSNHFCENFGMRYQLPTSHRYCEMDDLKRPFILGITAYYLDQSSGGIIWYDDQEELLETELNSLYLEIILSIAILIIIAILIFYFFRKWKRKKVKEIRISLPPIFDPTVMARLRLRNVDFPSSPSPPIEIMPSVSAPPRIFLDSMETTKIIGLSSANSTRTPDSSEIVDSPEVVDSSYTVMSAVQSTRTPNPPNLPDSVSSPYTEMNVMPDRFTYSQQK